MAKTRGSLMEAVLLVITEQLLILPLTFSILLLNNVKWIPVTYISYMVFALGAMILTYFLPKKKRIWLILVLMLAECALLTYISGLIIGTVIACILGLYISIRGIRLIAKTIRGISFYPYVVAGLVCYSLGTYLYSHQDILKAYIPLLAICATVAIISSYFCINMTHLNYERRVNDKVTDIPNLTKYSNVYLLILFSAIVLFVASLGFLDTIWGFLVSVFNFLWQGVVSFNDWFQNFLAPPPDPELELEDLELNELEPEELESLPVSPLTRFFSIAFYYIGWVAIIVLVVYFILKSYKGIARLFSYLSKRFGEIIKSFIAGSGGIEKVDSEYEDEINSLLKNGESAFKATGKWLSAKMHEEKPYLLLKNNAERARWLYKRMVRKELNRGLVLKETMTSHEVLEYVSMSRNGIHPKTLNATLDAYHEARYSHESMPDDEAIRSMKDFYSSKSPRV